MPARQPSARDSRPDEGVPAPTAAGPRDRLSPSIEEVPGAVLALDRNLRVVAANRAASDLVGRPGDEIVGGTFEDLLSVPARLLFQTHVYPALVADGRVEEVFLTLRAEPAEAVPVLLNAVRRDGEDGQVYVALLVQIRARSRWEQELLAATRALEREREESRRLADDLAAAARDLADRYAEEQRTREFRDAFVGIVSHELRTPITTIYGMSQLLLRGHQTMDSEAVGARLVDIEAESDRLRRLTEDLLVLSRAEGGRLEVAVEPLVLEHVVRAVVRAEQRRLPQHRVALAVEPGLPLVLGESTYVEQVVRNFLTNAGKYSPAGSRVLVSVARHAGRVAVRVVDEGEGFGSEPPDRLWDLFFRTPNAVRKSSGAGIGLFVSRALIVAMGGEVWAREVDGPGTGSEFGFWLPEVADPDDA